jgi:DeoR/GlpR family transcriptional regulator of sugar metabolism
MKVARSIILARRRSLAELLENHRCLPLAEVCARLGISPATARRDLRVLVREKKITRTYGGAPLPKQADVLLTSSTCEDRRTFTFSKSTGSS